MANIKSKKKRILTNEKARKRNVSIKSELKTLIRNVDSAIAEGNREAAESALVLATKKLDKAASKGVIHKNQAANRKSSVTKRVNELAS